MPTKDPIKKIQLASGKTRYRFVLDMGRKPDGRRDQRTFTYDTQKQAKSERARMISELAKGTLVAPAKTTLDSYLDSWLAGKRNLRDGTIERYEDALKPVREQLGSVHLQTLTKAQLDKLVDWMLAGGRRVAGSNSGLSARSVNIMLIVLTSALKSAVQQGLVARNIASLIERPSYRRPELSTWTAEQAGAYLSYVADDRYFVGWLLAMYGLRRSEVLGLRWSDIDLESQILTVRWARTAPRAGVAEGEPKTERSKRVLPLDDALVAALRKLKIQQAQEKLLAGPAYSAGCLLCTDLRGAGQHVIADQLGQPLRPDWFRLRFQQLAQEAGLPIIRLHDTRHTCGTLMHLRGVPIAVISAWLGHSSAAFTMKTYVHSQGAELVAAGGVISAALQPAS